MIPGPHGVHIHEGTSCGSVGGHFNPTMVRNEFST